MTVARQAFFLIGNAGAHGETVARKVLSVRRLIKECAFEIVLFDLILQMRI